MSMAMVQFALSYPYESIVDTEPMPYEEARELFDSKLEAYRFYLAEQPHREPEMALWIDVESDTDYHTTEFHLNHYDTEIDAHGRLVQTHTTVFHA